MNVIYEKKANGKFLLTSEYFVLDGAKAIALPTQLGQKMNVQKGDAIYKSYSPDGSCWLNTSTNIFGSTFVSNSKDVSMLSNIFRYIAEKKDISEKLNHTIQTYLEFDRSWGLGSSSTFIALLADYLEENPYELNRQFFKGSGYDIACAFAENPITYQLIENEPFIQSASIPLSIQSNLFFMYTGQKANSRDAIEFYKSLPQSTIKQTINDLDEITNELLKKSEFNDWEYILTHHEEILSKTLKIPKIQITRFPKFPFKIKSLGAWGGDFVLVLADTEKDELKKISQKYEIDTIFAYKEIIFQN